ncbi:mechanosensitive ion channel domain-containing protein [Desulfobacula sp.]|uniref:mechanosensitive ion channel domain-containing protein n=3 Tax=Desulfobacula sp. TaxID=2593537 RepID=UPI0039B942D4
MQIRKLNDILLLVIFFICLPSLMWGETNTQASLDDKKSLVQFEQAVEAAKTHLDVLEIELITERRGLKEEANQQQIYRTQMNSLRNFLLVPEISISVLEKGVEEIDISISLIKSKIQRTTGKDDKSSQTLSAVKDKIILIDQRIEESTSFKDKDIIRETGIKEFKSYRTVLGKQQKALLSLIDMLSSEINTNNELLRSFEDLRMTLRKEIKDKKGRLWSQRDAIEFKTFSSKKFLKETISSFAKIGQLFTNEWLSLKLSQLMEHINLSEVMVIAVFLLFSLFFFQGLPVLRGKELYKNNIHKRTGYPLIVLEGSLVIIFWILLTIILSKTQVYLIFPDFIKFIKTFLTIILITKIASDSIRLIVNEKGLVFFKALYGWRNAFIWGIRLYSLVYLLIFRFLSLDTVILASIRIFSEAVLVAGVFLFWKAYRKMESQTNGIEMKLLSVWSKSVVLSGLFADIAGYGHFASWWYISWGVSLVIISVCILLVYSMKDIDRKFKEKIEPESQSPYGISYPFYWILSKGLYFFIIVFALTGLAFSWSSSDVFFVWLWEIFNKNYVIGKIELSMVNFAYSILVILLTYLFTQLWEKVMARHVLKESGLSTGAKGSVTTISTYVIWSVGILISLSVFGLNSTSLAVVFGALSIGLGFGLQNIFNNFVSGLILLFERPIQVGDVVEVGGVWGEVKKINVRATLVQTYTNSSLIIPNSEFISALVTNWSHKDPFIRRDLMVGVAYGSDTALVKTLLLQAADSVTEVYDNPQKPRVQFINFGDSSLDFRLRFWSDIDNFIEAESKLRFETDRLFKANKVVIPFPQRDVHILSGPQVRLEKEIKDSTKTDD